MTETEARRLFWMVYIGTVTAAVAWFWNAPTLTRFTESAVAVVLALAVTVVVVHVFDLIAEHTKKRHPESHSGWRTPNP